MKKILGLLLMGGVVAAGLQANLAMAADEPIVLTQTGTYNSLTGAIEYEIAWKIATGTVVSALHIESEVAPGTTYLSSANGGVLAAGTVKWNIGPQTGPTEGTVKYNVALDAATVLNPWATQVIDYAVGKDFSGVDVPAGLTDPNQTTGSNDGNSAALGYGGTGRLILAFDMPAVNGTGTDITIHSTSPDRRAKVEGSNNLQDWVPLGDIQGTGEVEVGSLGSIDYVRILPDPADAGVPGSFGFEVDGVQQRHRMPLSCSIRSNATALAETGSGLQSANFLSYVNITPNCAVNQSSGGSGSGTLGISDVGGSTGSGGSAPGSTGSGASGGGPGASGGTPAPALGDVGGGEPEVLGAVTGLPRTGMPDYFPVALAALIAGVWQALSYPKLRRALRFPQM